MARNYELGAITLFKIGKQQGWWRFPYESYSEMKLRDPIAAEELLEFATAIANSVSLSEVS